MTEPVGIDDHAGSSTDEHVWCTCGWIVNVPEGSCTWRMSAELWAEHADTEHPLAETSEDNQR